MNELPIPGKIDCSESKVIIIVAGGQRSDGTLPFHVEQRLSKAFELGGQRATYICSSIFTLNKPQVTKEGWVLSEAAEMRRFLVNKYSAHNVLLENASFDTIGSAIFTRQHFDFIMKNQRIIVISSDFHIDRVSKIFSKVFDLAPDLGCRGIEFVGVESTLNSIARAEHEARSTERFCIQSENWHSVHDLKSWLFNYHENYCDFFSSRSADEQISEMGY